MLWFASNENTFRTLTQISLVDTNICLGTSRLLRSNCAGAIVCSLCSLVSGYRSVAGAGAGARLWVSEPCLEPEPGRNRGEGERERGHIPRDEESGKVGSGGHQLVRSAPCHHTTHGLDSGQWRHIQVDTLNFKIKYVYKSSIDNHGNKNSKICTKVWIFLDCHSFQTLMSVSIFCFENFS